MAKTKAGPERKSALRKQDKGEKGKAAKAKDKNADRKAKKISLIAAPAKVASKAPQRPGPCAKDKVKQLAA